MIQTPIHYLEPTTISPSAADVESNVYLQTIDSLSKREGEVLRLVANGFTTADIAQILHLSLLTVETIRKNIIRKLRVNNIVEAVAFALRNKLIE